MEQTAIHVSCLTMRGKPGGGADNSYNVTPSAAYTYRPAYQRYGHKINVVHFIGPNKPWANLQNRPAGMSLSKQNSASFECESIPYC